MTRRTLIIIALALFLCLSIPAAAVYWLCCTQPGLQWLAARVSGLGTVHLEFQGLTGVLRGPLHIDRFELDQERAHIVATDVHINVHLRRILLQTIDTDYLRIATLQVTLKPRVTPENDKPLHFLPHWLRINAHSVAVDESKLILLSGTELEATQVRAAAVLRDDRLKVSRAELKTGDLMLAGDATLRAPQPLRLSGKIDWIYSPAEQPRWAGQVSADGNLDRLTARGIVSEPLTASFEGSLLDLAHNWHWEANAQLKDFTLRPWSPHSLVSVPSATLAGGGAGERLHLSGTLEPQFPVTGPLEIKVEGSFAQRTLHASDLQLLLKSSRAVLAASGDVGFHGGWPELQLTGRWSSLAYPFSGKPLVRSEQGRFTLAGKVPYRYEMTASAAGWERSATVSSRGLLDQNAITSDELRAQVLGGEIRAQGSLGFGSDALWNVNAEVDGLDSQQIDARFPGSVSVLIDAAGRGFDRSGEQEVRVRNLRGRLRDQALSGHAHLRLSAGTIQIDDADLGYGAARLQARGDYGAHPSLAWDLNVPDFAQLLPHAEGTLTSRGALSGTRAETRVSGSVSAKDFLYGDYRVARLEGHGQIDLSDRGPSKLELSASDLKWGEHELHAVDIAIDGRASAHQVHVNVDAGNASLALRAQSAYLAGALSGTIDQFDLAIGDTHLGLAAPAQFGASQEHLQLAQFCLEGSNHERACAHGEWRNDGRWGVDLDASGVPLKIVAANLPRPSQYSGTLSLQANASAEPGKPWTGQGQAKFEAGEFRYQRPNGKTETIEVGTGEARFSALPERFQGDLRIVATEAAGLTANAAVDRTGADDWRRLPLSGEAHAETRALGFLPIFVPQIDRASGHLAADVQLGGKLGAPEINGSLTIDDGALDMYTTNMRLRDLKARMDLQGNGLKLAASVRAGSGTATLDGELAWSERKPHGTFKFKGTNLEVADVPEAHVRVSPDLRFTIDGRDLGVDGAVRIPSAMLAPADLSNATLASSDEVIVGREQESAEDRGLQVTAGILMALGKDVRVDSYGLKARVEGSITASTAPGEVSTAIGELKIAEDTGKYSAYLRELDVEQGRLVFSGGPLSDPGVDLRASKEFPEAKVGVNVRGTLRNPRLTFWSDPALPQTQIASLIVTGGKLESFQNSGATTSAQGSRSQLLAQGSAILATQVGQELGLNLEEVRVEADTSDTTRLVLGRYLSPRFYVSYGISFTEALNTLKLRYTISDKWTIKSEAGENRSVDLEFKIER